MAVKLSIAEKYAIQGMLYDDLDVKDIAEKLGRHVKTIQSYIVNELAGIHATIEQIQAQKDREANTEAVEESTAVKVAKRAPRNTGFINTTSSGKQGVAISTPASSAQSDYLQQKYPKQRSRTARGNIYNIDDQTVSE